MPWTTRATFRVVGIELGAKERVASVVYFAPCLQKALHSEMRLLSLEVPADVAAQMWLTTVLDQALYGCEILEMSHAQLRPLFLKEKSGISNKVLLELSNYCDADAVCGPPLGVCAVRDSHMEVATRAGVLRSP